jgi:hypothetical protein
VETIRLGIRVEDLAASKEKQTSSGMTKFHWNRGNDFQMLFISENSWEQLLSKTHKTHHCKWNYVYFFFQQS